MMWVDIIFNDRNITRARPMQLYCDNKSTINIAHNPIQHDVTKHIEIDKNFMKEKLDNGVIYTSYVHTHY